MSHSISNAKAIGGPQIKDRFEDRAACHHQITALAADAWQRPALVRGHGRKPAGDVAHRFGRNDQAIDGAAIILRQSKMDAGQRRHRTAGAKQA